MKIATANLINTTTKICKKVILPATLALGLTACDLSVQNNRATKDVFEKENVCITHNNVKKFDKKTIEFQKAVFQALPYINDGKFKKVEFIENGIILNDEYKLHKDKKGVYKGSYSLFDDHSFEIKRLKNGNFNLIYKKDDDIDALAFSKNGKLLSKFEAFKQNSQDGPYKLDLSCEVKPFQSIPKNTDNKIVKFNNPLSDKELNMIKNLIKPLFSDGRNYLVDVKQKGTSVFFNYDKNYERDFPETRNTMELKNTLGLIFENPSMTGRIASVLNIQALDNGGYVVNRLSEGLLLNSDNIYYFDENLNLRDKDWYLKDKALKSKIKNALSAAQKKKALENIQNGKPALFQIDDN